jgi:hypothetical protein
MKDYRAGNAMAPVGYVFSLEDPKVSDLAFDKSAAKDSKFAKTLKPWGDLVYTKLKGEEKFTDDAFLSGIEEPLWYRYETTENFRSFDDEDDDE